jgi:hypothetical protein
MPSKYRKDPVKRREYLQKLCGPSDGQVELPGEENPLISKQEAEDD